MNHKLQFNFDFNMDHWKTIFCSIVLIITTVLASPEIPTKGKHTRLQDAQQTSLEDADMPRFAEPIANVTVSVGRDALLACVVENLKGYKVAWVRVDTQTILSIHHNVISQNNRISLTYNDHRSWYLHIKEVEESDRGWYMCQVNTDPMRSRKGYLQVVVPPMIVESLTSNDMVVREGLNVTLQCKARGYPEPYVMWRREDGEEMLIGGEHVNVVDGELLHITKVSRLHMAAYLCVASNGVPPSISKRVHLRVQFPPMLSIPNQLEGAYVGQDVVLACHTEAYPASINYWTTERGDMIISDTSRAGDKYETTSTISGYTKYMKLKIRSVGPNDFGSYRCVAKNSLGETDGNIKLDEMPAPTTAVMSEMAMLNRSLDGKRRHRNKYNLNALPDYGVEEWRDGAGNALGNGGLGGAGSGNSGGDNNQTPVRHPPGALHNSAGSLAQRNPLAGIIHRIKMQSFGIVERLSSYLWNAQQEDLGSDGHGGGGGGNPRTSSQQLAMGSIRRNSVCRLNRWMLLNMLADAKDYEENENVEEATAEAEEQQKYQLNVAEELKVLPELRKERLLLVTKGKRMAGFAATEAVSSEMCKDKRQTSAGYKPSAASGTEAAAEVGTQAGARAVGRPATTDIKAATTTTTIVNSHNNKQMTKLVRELKDIKDYEVLKSSDDGDAGGGGGVVTALLSNRDKQADNNDNRKQQGNSNNNNNNNNQDNNNNGNKMSSSSNNNNNYNNAKTMQMVTAKKNYKGKRKTPTMTTTSIPIPIPIPIPTTNRQFPFFNVAHLIMRHLQHPILSPLLLSLSWPLMVLQAVVLALFICIMIFLKAKQICRDSLITNSNIYISNNNSANSNETFSIRNLRAVSADANCITPAQERPSLQMSSRATTTITTTTDTITTPTRMSTTTSANIIAKFVVENCTSDGAAGAPAASSATSSQTSRLRRTLR